jgi:hypothetical protein
MAIREDRFKANPADVENRSGLAASLLRSGQVKRAAGDAAGAAADWRRAVALYGGLPPRSGGAAVLEAGCHAMLSGIADITPPAMAAPGRAPEVDRASASTAGRKGSEIRVGGGEAEAGKAIDLLRHAITGGYRNSNEMARETSLEPVRKRSDFRLLLLDAAMPTEPFAGGE